MTSGSPSPSSAAWPPPTTSGSRRPTSARACYIAIHRYHRQGRGAYFDAFEAIAVNHGGRPHWGKIHTRGADYLRSVYPRFDDFLAVRDRVDPQRRFANPYLERVLGA